MKFIWLIFLITSITIFINFVSLTFSQYQLISYILFIGELVTFALSIKCMVVPYRFFREPISFIGRYEIDKKKNTLARKLYLIASCIFGIYCYVFANLLFNYFDGRFYVKMVGTCVIIAGIGLIMMSIIPIDLSRYGHLFFAFLLFSGFVIVSIITLLYLIVINTFYWWYTFAAGTQILTTFLYMLGYLKHYRASLFQKFWYFNMIFCLLAYINFYIDVYPILG
jgi:hypothetical protein